jgi:hypothetical protein
MIGLAIITSGLSIDYTWISEEASNRILPFSFKFGRLLYDVTPILSILALSTPFFITKMKKEEKYWMLLYFGLILILFAPIPYPNRFLFLTPVLIPIVVYSILIKQDEILNQKFLQIAILSLIAITILTNVTKFNAERNSTFYSLISKNESTSFTKISDLNEFTVTDPMSMLFLGILNKDRDSKLHYIESTTRKEMFDYLTISSNVCDAHPNQKVNFIISPRTIKWINLPKDKILDIAYNIWDPPNVLISNTLETQEKVASLAAFYGQTVTKSDLDITQVIVNCGAN